MRIISQSSGRGTGQRGLATAGVASIEPYRVASEDPQYLTHSSTPFVILVSQVYPCNNNFIFATH